MKISRMPELVTLIQDTICDMSRPHISELGWTLIMHCGISLRLLKSKLNKIQMSISWRDEVHIQHICATITYFGTWERVHLSLKHLLDALQATDFSFSTTLYASLLLPTCSQTNLPPKVSPNRQSMKASQVKKRPSRRPEASQVIYREPRL